MRRFCSDIWSTATEEWGRVWRDEGVTLIVVFALFIYSVIYSLGYGGEVFNEVPTAVVGGDNGEISRSVTRHLEASPKIRVAHEVATIAEAEVLLRERKVWGVVALSPTIDRDILEGRQAEVAILGDASYFLAYREVVEGSVAAIERVNVEITESRIGGGYIPPVIFEQCNLFNADLGYGVFVMPAIILLIMQQSALLGISMVSATRYERGERYHSDSPLAITIGRTITYVAIYALTLGFLLTVHYSLFDYPMRGVWWHCVAVIIPYVLSVVLLAQALGALFRRRESSIVWLLWLSIPFLLVSGASLPPQAFPRWLYLLGKIVPSSSAVEAWIGVQSRGATLADIASELTLMWCLVVLYGAGAIVANRNVRS
jgi:ABC-2 type transport system permease protein